MEVGAIGSNSGWVAWGAALAILAVLGPVGAGVGPGAADRPNDLAEDGCIPHPPIRISEDEGPQGFILATETGTGTPIYRPGSGVVAGQGTEQDPFRIEGWCISLPPLTPSGAPVGPVDGIRISGTASHVLVLDNVIENRTSFEEVFGAIDDQTDGRVGQPVERGVGIRVQDARNVSLGDNTVSGVAGGIHVDGSPGVRVQANDLTRTLGTGIRVLDSEAPDLENNTVVENRGTGLYVEGSNQVQIVENHLEGNEDEGLRVRLSDGGLVDRNVVQDNGEEGIQIGGFAEDVRVRSNTVQANAFEGIEVLKGSHRVNVTGNNVTGNRAGILLSTLDDGLVEDNDVTGNGDGIVILFAEDAIVTQNRIEENPGTGSFHPGYGVEIDRADRTEVHNNTILRNGAAGILVDGAFDAAQDNRLAFNQIAENDVGVRVGAGFSVATEGTVLRQNNIEENDQGVGLDASASDEQVDARENWWGCPDGPDDASCDDVVGDAVYDPWLDEPNPEAGAS